MTQVLLRSGAASIGASIVALGAAGCGLQATSGAVSTSAEAPERLAVTTTATMQATRKSNTMVGVRGTFVPSHGVELKQVVLHGGYDFLGGDDVLFFRHLPRALAIGIGPELGAGGPVSDRFAGVGAYFGGAATPRLRVSGNDDFRHSFSIIFTAVELVLNLRGGAWFPPEASGTGRVFSELGAELGLRLVLGSDLVSAAQGAPRGDELPEDGTGERPRKESRR